MTRLPSNAANRPRAVSVRPVPGDHMVLIDPAGEPWTLVRDWLRARVGGDPARSTLGP